MFMEGNDENDLNDASGIVWAHSEFRLSFMFLTNTISCILRGQGRRATMEMAQMTPYMSFGPLVSIFLSFMFKPILTSIFRYNSYFLKA